MSKSTITSKGQTTIPADIRAFLGVGPGDELQYFTEGKYVFIIPRRYKAMDLFGVLGKPDKPVTDREIKQGIAEFWARKAPRQRNRRKHKS